MVSCAIKSVGAIHESPAAGTPYNAPHQRLPLMRELAPQATEGEKTTPQSLAQIANDSSPRKGSQGCGAPPTMHRTKASLVQGSGNPTPTMQTRCDSTRRGRVTRPLYAPSTMYRTKASLVQREVPRRAGGIASCDTEECSLESVGAIHESPAVRTADIAPH